MFDWFTKDGTDAISMLKNDHDRVKKLFDEFKSAKTRPAKKKIVGQTLTELKVHAALEEDIFYAAVRKKLEKQMMNEADEEHHVAKILIAELGAMSGAESHYDAKYQVLSENVRHHIKEEEGEMLPKAKGLNIDYDQLGERMRRHKRELLTKGFPKVGEETMVAAGRRGGDSPAKAAKKTIQVRPKSKK